MKLTIFLFLFVIMALPVFSVSTEYINLEYGKSAVIAGRNITLISVSYDNLLVSIDGEDYILPIGEPEENDGVEISTGLIYEQNKYQKRS